MVRVAGSTNVGKNPPGSAVRRQRIESRVSDGTRGCIRIVEMNTRLVFVPPTMSRCPSRSRNCRKVAVEPGTHARVVPDGLRRPSGRWPGRSDLDEVTQVGVSLGVVNSGNRLEERLVAAQSCVSPDAL